MKKFIRPLILVLFLFGLNLLALTSPARAAGPAGPPDCSTIQFGRCLNSGYFTDLSTGLPPLDCAALDGSCDNAVGHETLLPAFYFYSDPVGTPVSQFAFPNASDPNYGVVNGMPPGVAAKHFIALINSYLNAPNPGGCTLAQPNPPLDVAQDSSLNPYAGCYAWRREVVGAAFLVLTMTGGPYTAYPGSAGPPASGPGFIFGNNLQTGVNDAKVQFANWATLVTEADAAGDVNWDETQNLPAGIVNSYSADFGHDVAAYASRLPDLAQMIVFSSASGTYEINRFCSNVEGTLSSLSQILGYNVGLTATGTVSEILPGQTGTIDLSLTNSGLNPAAPGALQVQLPGAGVAEPCLSSCSDPGQTTLTSGETSQGFRSGGSEVPGVSGAGWYWDTPGLAVGGVSSGSLTFTVPTTAVPGSIITFQVYYYPADAGGSVAQATVQFKVEDIAYPSVVGLNGDVHAGGGLCGAAQSTGNVQGNPLGASYGQYGVSASGSISGFGSNGAFDNTMLNLGQTGSYVQICQPDLYAAAQNYLAAGGAGAVTTGSGVYDISSWKGVHYITGNANICGTVNNPTTIVQQSGTLTIGGNGCPKSGITLTNTPTPRSAAPSLGIIAGPLTSIAIAANVTQVDAYLFSEGSINTCDTTWGGTCNSTLTVNGFVMGHDLQLRRLGSGNGAEVAEKITLNPQIYLNPPQFFDANSASGGLQLQGLGERPPLF